MLEKALPVPCGSNSNTSMSHQTFLFLQKLVFFSSACKPGTRHKQRGRHKPESRLHPERRWPLSEVIEGEKYHPTSKLSITCCTAMYDCIVVLCPRGTDRLFFHVKCLWKGLCAFAKFRKEMGFNSVGPVPSLSSWQRSAGFALALSKGQEGKATWPT